MKKSKLLIFTLIPIAVFGIVTINVPATFGQDGTSENTPTIKKNTDETRRASETKSTIETKGAVETKSAVETKAKNTIGVMEIALGILGVLNIIGLGATFWLNKQAIDKIKDKARTSDQKIEKLKSQYQPLEHQVKKVDSDYQNYSNKTNKELERLRQSLEEVSRKAASMQQSAAIPQSNYRSERQSSSAERYPAAPVNIQLSPTEYYNNNQNDFQHKYQITAVSREAENLNQSRAAQTDSVVLAGDKQGNYWLFPDNTETYLVPKQNLKITDNRISTTRDLFECQDYNEYNYNNFVLIKPAVLVQQGSGTWQLKEKGKLQFG